MADRFIGTQYPLVNTPRGILAQKKGVDQIKASLLQLLLTNPGERVMLPTYGTPLRRLIFEPNDSILEIEAKRVIAEAIAEWEPRVNITDIVVSRNISKEDLNNDDTLDQKDNILNIKIKFVDPEDIQVIDELVLEI